MVTITAVPPITETDAPEKKTLEERAIVADDDEGSCRLVAALIKAHSSIKEVDEVESGDRLLAKIFQSRDRYSLVVTDYAMPGSSGLYAIARISEHHPEIPSILMSSEPDLLQKTLSAGGVEFVQKDTDNFNDKMIAAIQYALGSDAQTN